MFRCPVEHDGHVQDSVIGIIELRALPDFDTIDHDTHT